MCAWFFMYLCSCLFVCVCSWWDCSCIRRYYRVEVIKYMVHLGFCCGSQNTDLEHCCVNTRILAPSHSVSSQILSCEWMCSVFPSCLCLFPVFPDKQHVKALQGICRHVVSVYAKVSRWGQRKLRSVEHLRWYRAYYEWTMPARWELVGFTLGKWPSWVDLL